MTAVIGGIAVEIIDDSARFTQSMQRNAALVEQQSQRMSAALGGTAKSVDELGRKASNFQPDAFRSLSLSALRANNSVERLQKTVLALSALSGGGLGGALVVKTLTDTADRYANIQNRIATISKSSQDRAAIEQQIFLTAQNTRSSYEATAALYQRLAISAKSLGVSQTQITQAVETTQKALVVGSATPAEAASIATQLTQALGSGRLQGDELRAILENSATLAEAIAKEFGVSVGELKEMGSEGSLNATRVLKAILNAGAEIDDQFSKMRPTLQQAFVVLDNGFTRYIGQVDKSLGLTSAMANGIIGVANNIHTLGDALLTVAPLVAAVFAGRFLARAPNAAVAQYQSVKAEREGAAATAEKSAASATQALADVRQRAQVNPESFVEAQILQTRETLRKELERENAAVLTAEEKYQAALKAAAQQPGAVATGGAALAPERQALRQAQDELRRAERGAAQAAANDAPVRMQERLNASVEKEAQLRSRLNNLTYEARRNLPETIGDPSEAQVKGTARLVAVREQLNRREQETARLAAEFAAAEEAAMAQAVAANERLVAAKAGVTAAEHGLIGAAQTRSNNATVRNVLEAQAGVDIAQQRAAGTREALGTAQSVISTTGAANATKAVDEAQKAAKASADALAAAESGASARMIAAGAAASSLATILGNVKTAGASVVAFLGGPIGAVLTALIAGWGLYEVAQAKATAALEEFKTAADATSAILERLRQAQESGSGVPGAVAAAQLNINNLQTGLSTSLDQLIAQIPQVSNRLLGLVPVETQQSLIDLQAKLFDVQRKGGDVSPVLKEIQAALAALGAENPTFAGIVTGLQGIVDRAVDAWGKITRLQGGVRGATQMGPTIEEFRKSYETGSETPSDPNAFGDFLKKGLEARAELIKKGVKDEQELQDRLADAQAAAAEDREAKVQRAYDKLVAKYPDTGRDRLRQIAELETPKDKAKTKETPEERVSEKIKRITEEAEASFLPEADQETLREITKLKGTAEIAKKVRADLQAGRPLSGEFADLRSATVAKEAAKEYKNIVTEYGNLNQVAPFVRSEQEKLNKLLEMGKIDTQQYGLALADYLGKFQQFKWIDQAADSVKTFGDSIADAFYDGKLNAESFGQAIDNLGKQLFKLALNESVLTPIRNMLRGGLANLVAPGAAAAGGGGANPFDLSNVTAAEIMHTGGMVGFGSTRRLVPIGLFQDAPHFAGGLRPNEFRAILHQGEAVLTRRDQQGVAAMAGALSGMKGGVNVTINEAPGTQAQVSQSPDGGLHVDILQLAEAGLADRIGRGQGTLAKAVRQSGTRGNLRG